MAASPAARAAAAVAVSTVMLSSLAPARAVGGPDFPEAAIQIGPDALGGLKLDDLVGETPPNEPPPPIARRMTMSQGQGRGNTVPDSGARDHGWNAQGSLGEKIQAKAALTSWSPEAVKAFASGPNGCSHSRPPAVYRWRGAGMGSNLDGLIMGWIRSIVELGVDDMAIIENGVLDDVKCPHHRPATAANATLAAGGGRRGERPADSERQELGSEDEEEGEGQSGLQCLFAAMPHVCVFKDDDTYRTAMLGDGMHAAAVEDMLAENSRGARRAFREAFLTAPEGGLARYRAFHELAAGHMFRHMSEGLLRDVEEVGVQAHAALPPTSRGGLRGGPGTQVNPGALTVGLHVRRGDKKHEVGDDGFRPIDAFLRAAHRLLVHASCALPPWATAENPSRSGGGHGGGGGGGSGVHWHWHGLGDASPNDVVGVFVATDDPGAVEEVREAAGEYFPRVEGAEAVAHTLGGVSIHTSRRMGYGQAVHLFNDILQLVRADVFVGTYTSNLSRIVSVLRTGMAGKAPTTEMSVDMPMWFPGLPELYERLISDSTGTPEPPRRLRLRPGCG